MIKLYLDNQDPSKRVIYVHSEKFVADMVKALQLNAINEFKNFSEVNAHGPLKPEFLANLNPISQ